MVHYYDMCLKMSGPVSGVRWLKGFSVMISGFLNAGMAAYSDKLFKFRNGRFEDLLSDELNIRRGVANQVAGRSVACVDRKVSKTSL